MRSRRSQIQSVKPSSGASSVEMSLRSLRSREDGDPQRYEECYYLSDMHTPSALHMIYDQTCLWPYTFAAVPRYITS